MQENRSGDVTAILKVIKEQKDNFSKAIEAALSQSKHDLLDDSLADSIHQKICDAVNKLEIHILKQDGKKYLELRPDGIDVNANDFIISFCKQELGEWAEEEWRKISRYYGSGGLEGLVKNTNVTLKTVNEYNSESLALRLRSEIECEGIFQLSLRRIPCHTDYHEDPIWIYFIKKIRSSVFQVMGILFLLSFLGVSRGSFIKQINKQIANSPFLLLLVSGITTWLLYKLYKTYRNDKEIEAQKIAEKVRKELRDYYQKITKNRFMDRIVQILELNLREEIMRLDEAVKSFLQTSQTRKATISDNQLFLQSNLKQYQDEVKKFDRKLREIQRIKDKLQRHRPGNDTPILF